MTGAAQELARRPSNGLATRDPIQLAEHFARSGYFKDAADLSKAVVKIVAGEELGIGPMASMQGIHIIEGKPSLSANLLGGLVKRHPVYDYVPREHTDALCQIEFLQNGESIGVSEFTIADAERAGVKSKPNWQRYPKAMLFARALSQGVRWYCPDVTAGSLVYVPEELGAEVDQQGEVVSVPSAEVAAAESVLEDEGLATTEQVEQILKGFQVLRLSYADVGLAIGAVGGERQKINRADSIHKALRALTQEQASTLIDHLEAESVSDGGE